MVCEFPASPCGDEVAVAAKLKSMLLGFVGRFSVLFIGTIYVSTDRAIAEVEVAVSITIVNLEGGCFHGWTRLALRCLRYFLSEALQREEKAHL